MLKTHAFLSILEAIEVSQHDFVLDIFPTTADPTSVDMISPFYFVNFLFFCSCNAYFLFSPPPAKRLTLEIPCDLSVNVGRNIGPNVEILEKLDDGVFVRTLQCLAAAQKGHKEPSLMPVPSPQQISYLNQFEGNTLGWTGQK